MEAFWDTNGDRILQTVAVVFISWLLWRVLTSLGHRALVRMSRGEDLDSLHRKQRLETLWVAIRRLALILYVVAVAIAIGQLWGFPVASLTAVGAAAGFAIGFGAQSLVKDVIAGFFILAEDQYRIGDVIRVAGVAGAVEDIQLRVTVLRDLDSNLHFIPNGAIAVATNLTPDRAKPVIDIGISYDADVDHALAVLADELDKMAHSHEWEDRVLEEPEVLGVQELGDSAVVLRAVLTVAPEERWSAKRAALRLIKQRFDAEGIEIPFPQRTLTIGDKALREHLLERG